MSLRQRAEALHAFQHDPPTTIFLLSMRYVSSRAVFWELKDPFLKYLC
jgi:hypothetical protein